MPVGARKDARRPGTRDRILAAAERLFAEYGYDGVSVRQIGAEADVQIALISYHFGTKEDLYRAVFEHRIAPVSERRREALARALATPGSPPRLEAVLDALARPWIEMRGTEEGRHYTRLIAREVNDPREAERGIVRDLLDPIALEFLDAMERALPEHPRLDIHWAYYFFVSTLLLMLANPERVARLSGDLMARSSDDDVVRRLVSFVVQSLTGIGPRTSGVLPSESGASPPRRPRAREAD